MRGRYLFHYSAIDKATISAMSITFTLSSCSLFFTPSVSMVVQKGQLAAITLAPVSSASGNHGGKVSLCESPRKAARAMGTQLDERRDGELQMAQAAACGADRVHRVDARRASEAF